MSEELPVREIMIKAEKAHLIFGIKENALVVRRCPAVSKIKAWSIACLVLFVASVYFIGTLIYFAQLLTEPSHDRMPVPGIILLIVLDLSLLTMPRSFSILFPSVATLGEKYVFSCHFNSFTVCEWTGIPKIILFCSFPPKGIQLNGEIRFKEKGRRKAKKKLLFAPVYFSTPEEITSACHEIKSFLTQYHDNFAFDIDPELRQIAPHLKP